MKNMQRTIRRYAKIYGVLLRLNWATLFAYRASMISSIISHTAWATFIIVSMLLLTSKTSSVFGWTRNELLILAGMYNVVYSVFYFLFSRNFNEFVNLIHFGRLDAILTKPIDSQFLISCTIVSYTHIIRFFIGVGFLIFVLSQMHAVITPILIIICALLVVLSVLIIYSFWFLVMTLTLWFTKLSNLMDLLYEIKGITKFPQEVYKGASIYLLVALFPLTLVVVVPAKALLQKMLLGDVVWPLFFAVVMFVAARKFWQYALRSYTSASG